MEEWLAQQVKSQNRDLAENVLTPLPSCVTPTPIGFCPLFMVSVRLKLHELLQLLHRWHCVILYMLSPNQL